jgi:putative redox protein
MLLASLGACTGIVLHTYAQHHDVDLQEVELNLQYQRVFQDDCENCSEDDRYDEVIDMELTLFGDLTGKERNKLYHIAQHCSVHKMLEAGIKIHSRLEDKGDQS